MGTENERERERETGLDWDMTQVRPELVSPCACKPRCPHGVSFSAIDNRWRLTWFWSFNQESLSICCAMISTRPYVPLGLTPTFSLSATILMHFNRCAANSLSTRFKFLSLKTSAMPTTTNVSRDGQGTQGIGLGWSQVQCVCPPQVISCCLSLSSKLITWETYWNGAQDSMNIFIWKIIQGPDRCLTASLIIPEI